MPTVGAFPAPHDPDLFSSAGRLALARRIMCSEAPNSVMGEIANLPGALSPEFLVAKRQAAEFAKQQTAEYFGFASWRDLWQALGRPPD